MFPALFIFRGGALSAVFLCKLLSHILVHAFQNTEVLGVEFQLLVGVALIFVKGFGVFFDADRIFDRKLLEERVCLQFFEDRGAQFHRRSLQDLQRVTQLRRKHQRLGLFLCLL